jgi:PIN domain nuclease of toxin-antitoxin system
VNLLLDTHALLWFLRDDPSLSTVAKVLILDPANHKFVSVASCWEIAIKAARKKLSLAEPSGILLGR